MLKHIAVLVRRIPATQQSTRWYSPRGRSFAENAGVGRRMKLFERDQHDEEFKDFDELESDFMQSHRSHKEVEREMAEQREKLSSWVVRDKYFKSHHLNLLTYTEKQQIKHLHDTDPTEWTVEKLVKSFPATEQTILKVIKSKWAFRDEKRIAHHDQKVEANWEALTAGDVPGISTDLRKHLLTFADREIKPLPPVEEQRPNLLELPHGQFSEIITSAKRPPTQQLAIADERTKHSPEALTHTTREEEKGDRQPMTIELFRDASGLLQPTESPASTSAVTSSSTAHRSLGARVEMVAVPAELKDNAKNFVIGDRITIPRKLRRAGATYKVHDSYFDDDGEFLYRVPGMTSR